MFGKGQWQAPERSVMEKASSGGNGGICNVLFLCRHNAARSIMAECLMRHWGKGRFAGFSAGCRPAAMIHPEARAVLDGYGIGHGELRPKSWKEFARAGAPRIDIVVAVDEPGGSQACAAWPGAPVATRWPVDDPAAVTQGAAAMEQAFRHVFLVLEARIRLVAGLRVESLDRPALQRRLDEIGHERETVA